MTIRVFEAFAGVGSQRMALRNLGIKHEVVAISDVDEFTVKSYASIHNSDKVVSQVTDGEMQSYLEKRNIPLNDKGVRKTLKGKKLKEFYDACIKSNNLGDISKVVTQDIPDHDLFTYSFPCQDISVAGKGLGLNEGSDTRSGLLWECQKVIAGKKPKYLLLENVKNLVGKKHKHNFDRWLEWLEEQGYTNYWQVLNAKNYGIPQNRERVFVVSILGDHTPYKFPEPIELELRLKDVLESEVDEKFYLSEEKTQQLITTVSENYSEKTIVKMNRNEVKKENKVANTLLARDYKGFGNQDMNGVIELKSKRIGGIFDKDGKKHQAGAVWDKNQLSPALDTMQGGWRHPSVVVDDTQGFEDTPRIYKDYAPSLRASRSGLKTIETDSEDVVIGASRGRNPENPSDRTVGSPTEQRLEINNQGTSNTITTVQKDNYVVEQVRRLAETKRPNDEIGVTLKVNGDIRPHRMDKKKSGIQELNINHEDNSSHTITTNHMPKVYGDTTNLRIRKLTPKECWRLMGFSDDDFHKSEEVNSNSQLYKQAGNSIVVDVLEGIFKQLLEEK